MPSGIRQGRITASIPGIRFDGSPTAPRDVILSRILSEVPKVTRQFHNLPLRVHNWMVQLRVRHAEERGFVMVEIHVYGKLRRYAGDPQRKHNSVVMLEPRPGETITSVLAHVGVPVDEIQHIFFNSKLHATRTSTAPYLDYQQSRSDLFDWDLDVPVGNGDRIGLFGKDMSILGM